MASKTNKIKVLIAGAAGKMGQASVESILCDRELELVAAIGRVDSPGINQELLEICNLSLERVNRKRGKKAELTEFKLKLESNLSDALQRTNPDVFLDLSVPNVVYQNAQTALSLGVNVVSGATGLSYEDALELGKKAEFAGCGILVAPNFSIGALLMIHFAKIASRYFENAEIIETHHNQKVDAPSGTALKTAKEMSQVREFPSNLIDGQENSNKYARGFNSEGVRIHSLRLPGFLAKQKVLLSAPSETLSITHNTTDRGAFMPGIILSLKEVIKTEGLTYGLENILQL